MAGIDNLKRRILKDDEDRAKQALDDAASRSEEMLKHAGEKADLLVREAASKAIKDGEDRKERIIARAGMDARNSILSAKQEAISRILKLAQDKISRMGSREYTDFIEELILNSVEYGDEEVIFAEEDKKRLDPDIISRVNDKLSLKNIKGSLKFSSEDRKITSGFILKRGGIEMNCSISSQIRMLRDSLEVELAGILFEKK